MKITVKTVRKTSILPRVTLQQAHDRQLFGPVYHGTYNDGHTDIHTKGFQVIDNKSMWSNGYSLREYGNTGYPPPMHHLGIGVYFTTNKAIATRYNKGTSSGLIPYYLDIPKLLKINFGSTNTMMKWWRSHGYDFEHYHIDEEPFGREREWYRATKNLTKVLAAQYDAVWFTGKGFKGTLLDGDQICVYDPSNKVFILDNTGVTGLQLGAKVRLKPVHILQQILVQHRLSVKPDFWTNNPNLVPVYSDNMLSTYFVPSINVSGTVIKTHGDTSFVKWSKGGSHWYLSKMLEVV